MEDRIAGRRCTGWRQRALGRSAAGVVASARLRARLGGPFRCRSRSDAFGECRSAAYRVVAAWADLAAGGPGCRSRRGQRGQLLT